MSAKIFLCCPMPTHLGNTQQPDWNRDFNGAIWAGCHAVSVLESLVDPNDATRKMNFLSSNGLIPFTDHNPTSTPFSRFLPGDPVGQYYNKTDNAQTAGSETVYLPKLGSSWNAGAKILTSSPGQEDIPGLSSGAAVENIYGHGFDIPTRGYVAYQASHNISGTTQDQIAAQRIFFNFSLVALNAKIPPIISASLNSLPATLTAGTPVALSASVTGTASGFTYKWSTSETGVGSFDNTTSATPTFTPASVTSATSFYITCVVTQTSCGRISFDSKKVTILPTPSGHPLITQVIRPSIPDGCTSASVTFNVLDSIVDAGAGPRTLVSVTGLGSGTVITSTNGNITFTPAANFKGLTTGTYTISNTSTTASGAISITVGDNTLAPDVSPDAVTVISDNLSADINVLSNDLNKQGAASNSELTVRSISTKPTKGYAYINVNGTISYLSKKDDAGGSDSFQYLTCNNAGYCTVGTVNVTIVPDLCSSGEYQLTTTGTTSSATFTPVADSYIQGASTTANAGSVVTMQAFGFTSNLKEPLIRFDLSSINSSSTVNSAGLSITTSNTTFTPSGTVNSFNPANIYAVSKSWTESGVTWNSFDGITNWTTAGLSTSDYSTTNSATMTLTAGVAVTSGTVIGSTSMKNMVQAWVTTSANNKGLVIVPSGSNNTGAASQPTIHSNESATAGAAPRLYVNYTVPAACFVITGTSYNPVAYPDEATTNSVTPVTIDVITNDENYYSNTINVTAVTQPSHGATVLSGTGSVTYTPNGSFVGVDVFTYTLKDMSKNTTFTANVRVTVTRAAPAILPDASTVSSGISVTVNVGANDLDLNGTVAAAPVITINPKSGSAVVSGATIVYTPSAGFVGKDTLVYSRVGAISDNCAVALSDTALVIITVTNRTPITTNASLSTFACAPITINLLDIASDPEGGALSVTITTAAAHGTLTATGAGKYLYTPTTNYTGPDNFQFTVTDPLNATSLAATVSITVSGSANPNISPVAVDDRDSTLAGQLLFVNVLANDSDPNNDPLAMSISASGLKAPSNGTIQLMVNKLIKYTPNANFRGIDTFQYQITDTHPGCATTNNLSATARVIVKVTSLPILAGGTIWNDTDQSGTETFTNIQTGSETGTNVNGSIYVYLIDSTSSIIDYAPVDNAGVYQLSNVPSSTPKLTLLLSTDILSVGGTITSPKLPTNWTNTSPAARVFTSGTTDITGYDFGIVTSLSSPGTISSTNYTYCVSGTPGTIATIINANTSTVQWQQSTTSAGAGFADISGANSPAIQQAPSALPPGSAARVLNREIPRYTVMWLRLPSTRGPRSAFHQPAWR
jgi:hypothetical protein